jgi:hypothetical protein
MSRGSFKRKPISADLKDEEYSKINHGSNGHQPIYQTKEMLESAPPKKLTNHAASII